MKVDPFDGLDPGPAEISQCDCLTGSHSWNDFCEYHKNLARALGLGFDGPQMIIDEYDRWFYEGKPDDWDDHPDIMSDDYGRAHPLQEALQPFLHDIQYGD